MAGVDGLGGPGGVVLDLVEVALERRPAGGQDVGAIGDGLLGPVELHRLGQREQGMHVDLLAPEFSHARIVGRGGDAHEGHQPRRRLLTVDVELPPLFAGDIPERLAIGRQEGVQIDQGADAAGAASGHAGDHHAAIGVADQDRVGDVLVFQDVRHVLDVGRERDAGMGKVRAFTQAGEGDDIDLVTRRSHQPRRLLVAPAAGPGAVHQYEGRHARSQEQRI